MTDHSVDANKIVAGMRAAVAHAKGDETAATVHVVTRADALRALAERVEKGETIPFAMCAIRDVGILDDSPYRGQIGVFIAAGAYLDAVAALQEAVLPGWRLVHLRRRPDGKCEAALARPGRGMGADVDSDRAATTLCQAWLAACLRALAMEADRG